MNEEINYLAPATLNSTQIELNILQAIVLTPMLLHDARRIIKTSMFSNENLAKFWDKLCEMTDKNQTIRLELLQNKTDSKTLKSVITASNNAMYTTQAMMESCLALRSIGLKRAAYQLGNEMIQKASDATIESEEILSFPEKASKKLHEWDAESDNTQTISESIQDLGATLEDIQVARNEGRSVMVPTGFRTLDYVTNSGFYKGQLIVLAARPSVGKTAVMLYMAKHASMVHKIPTLIFNLEMTNQQLAKRIIASTRMVSTRELSEANVDWGRFEAASSKFTNVPLYLNDRERVLEMIIAKIIFMVKKVGIRIVYIDYGGLIEVAAIKDKEKTRQRMEEVTRRLKETAKDCNIPIVLLAQLNRGSAADGREPQLYDLRDSGSIEQDADIVLMLDRTRTNGGKDVIDNSIDMYVRKNRDGLAGNVVITLKASEGYTVFTDEGDMPEHNIKPETLFDENPLLDADDEEEEF